MKTSHFSWALLLVLLSLCPAVQADDEALMIFQRRVLPILQSDKPSSCTECHLSGVDLKQYLHPTQEQTFAALVAGGLIDTEKPGESKLLEFIARKPKQPSLINDKIRQQELAAMRAWIEAAVSDKELLALKLSNAPAGPSIPPEVIRHARTDRVLDSFITHIWTEVVRCAACHSPDRNQKQVEKHGEQVSWIKLNDPQATLDHLLEYELIDLKSPADSLILTKPTLQVEHGGGRKMAIGDRTYKQFRAFLDDYAAIRAGEYRAADELPAPPSEFSVVSEIWLKVTDIPVKHDKQLMQVDLYRWTDAGWSEQRVATSDRNVFGPKQLWQHSLSLTAPVDSRLAERLKHDAQLPPGRYLARIYLDQQGKLEQDFRTELGPADLVGEVDFTARWRAGYGNMLQIEFPRE